MSFTDALSRISTIQQQMTALNDGTLLSGAGTSTGTAGASGTSSTASTDTETAFADALAQAEGVDGTSTGDGTATDATSDDTTSLVDDLLSASSTSSTSATAGTALPAAASAEMTSDQRQFASTLSADTGLNPGVVCAWVLSEENGSAAQSRQAAGNNDWLNVGYTDSTTYGATDGIWSDPVSAASATAAWLKGSDSITGYGTASSGIQSILSSVGGSPQEQISALQNSGWASSGYPDLTQVYDQVSGSTAV